MRALVQRVSNANVRIDDTVCGSIGRGLMILLGVGHEDTDIDADQCIDKIINLRIFEDDAGKMNRSVADIGGEILAVSQFTLYADTKKGNRPSFTDAAPPQQAELLYNLFCCKLREKGFPNLQTGRFAAHMHVSLVNDGPVTIMITSKREHV